MHKGNVCLFGQYGLKLGAIQALVFKSKGLVKADPLGAY